jgi:hypothetical protein
MRKGEKQARHLTTRFCSSSSTFLFPFYYLFLLRAKIQHSGSDAKAIDQWTRWEQENQKTQQSEALRAQLDDETNPKRTCLHKLFVFISSIAGISALLMFIGQFVGVRYENTGLIQYILRFYVIFFCLLAVLVELEWTKLVQDSSILKYWVTRGIFYAFIGVLGLEQNESYALRHATLGQHTTPRPSAMTLKFIQVVAWLMVSVGILYFAMGVLCLQLVYSRVRQSYKERLQRAVQIRDTTSRYMEHVV